MINFSFQALGAAVLAAIALSGGTASAAPGNRSSQAGAARAAVVQPIRIVAVNALRFGQIARPTTAGTITMSPLGVITATSGLLPSTAITQTGTRGPGSFTITGDPNRVFRLTLPSGFILLRNGTRVMILNNFRSSAGSAGNPSLNAAGSYTLTVGASLIVGANQNTGTYSGTYTATVVYQ